MRPFGTSFDYLGLTDYGAVFYGVLDFCAKPLFSIALIVGHWNIKPDRLGLEISTYSNDDVLNTSGSKDMANENGNGGTGVTSGSHIDESQGEHIRRGRGLAVEE